MSKKWVLDIKQVRTEKGKKAVVMSRVDITTIHFSTTNHGYKPHAEQCTNHYSRGAIHNYCLQYLAQPISLVQIIPQTNLFFLLVSVVLFIGQKTTYDVYKIA